LFAAYRKRDQQSTGPVNYSGPKSHMSGYIQAKYNETEGLFVLFSADELKSFDLQAPVLAAELLQNILKHYTVIF